MPAPAGGASWKRVELAGRDLSEVTGALPQTPNEDPQRAQEGSGALRPLSLQFGPRGRCTL